MVAFTAASVLTASALNSAFNAYTVNAQTGTTYTFVLTDQGGLVTASNASASTYTVPTNASVAYATGTRIELLNIGAGTVTLSPAGGVTLNGTTTVPQNGRVVLVKQATNTWYANALGGGGLTLITTVSLSGTSVSVNNCFTSSYANYRAVLSYASTSGTDYMDCRLRVGGADNSTTSYEYGIADQLTTAATLSPRTTGSATTFWRVGYSQTASAASHTTFDVIAPQLAQATMFSMSGMTDTRAMFGGGRFSASTQFDGLTIYSEAGGTLSGTLRIYGYQN